MLGSNSCSRSPLAFGSEQKLRLRRACTIVGAVLCATFAVPADMPVICLRMPLASTPKLIDEPTAVACGRGVRAARENDEVRIVKGYLVVCSAALLLLSAWMLPRANV